jgi:hypothetical protein
MDMNRHSPRLEYQSRDPDSQAGQTCQGTESVISLRSYTLVMLINDDRVPGATDDDLEWGASWRIRAK